MLYEIMKHIRNFFPGEFENGRFSIQDGTIDLRFVESGQYVLIEGSKLNDGIYQYPLAGLSNENFVGVITALNIPKDFIALANEIKDWNDKNEPSAFASESFGGYSYSKALGKNGAPAGWKEVFGSRLNSWRKI